MNDATRDPAPLGGAVTLIAALAGVAVLAGSVRQLLPVASYAASLLVVVVGASLRRRDRRLFGGATTLFGFGAVLASLGLAAALPESLGVQVTLTAGLSGATLFVLAVFPLRREWSRGLARFGTVVLVGCTVLAVVLETVGDLRAVVAVAATLVAWDAAERARTMGEEVGRGAATAGVELTRAGGTLAIATAGAGFALAAYGTTPAELPASVLAVLFGATLVWMAALYD